MADRIDMGTDALGWLAQALVGEGKLQAEAGSLYDGNLAGCVSAGLLRCHDAFAGQRYYSMTDAAREGLAARLRAAGPDAVGAEPERTEGGPGRFPNLAGRPGADQACLDELAAAGVPAFRGIVPVYGEVRTEVVGLLGADWLDEGAVAFLSEHRTTPENLARSSSFVLTRAWYYWIVEGHVPRHVAILIHADPRNEGKIRVNGHGGSPAPDDAQLTRHRIAGHRCVSSYHVDTALGLGALVEHLRSGGLV